MAKTTWRRNLVIRLNSDLCVASGDGFSSSVDVDVCHDRTGLPIIPARRLKGCLRDVACLLGYEGTTEFDALFGTRGSSNVGSLRITDATLPNADALLHAVLGDVNPGDSQSVLSLFTYTRAQTAIDVTGSAKDGTLRFVRVVKQYVPEFVLDEKSGEPIPLEFVSDVTCEDNEAQIKLLITCCKALRNIGYGRNRGFGAVSCELQQIDSVEPLPVEESFVDSADVARVSYAVHLDSSVMLPQQNGLESLEYIPGSSVLGYFAGKLSGADDFDELFLRGNVRFSPLYPVKDGTRCCPAPPFVIRVKGGERDGETCTVWQVREGETAKPLKDGFVDARWQQRHPLTEIVYHHSVNVPDEDKSLYTQRCLQSGQLFSGFIEGNSSALKRIVEVIAENGRGNISFGRSKTAQYSRCSLVGMRDERNRGSIEVLKGRRYAFLLDSDALILRDGAYTTFCSDLESAIREALGNSDSIFDSADFDNGADHPGSNLRYRLVTGYNAKWNQKKPHVQAFGAGSCIVFEAASSVSDVPVEFFIDERPAEGFGRVLMVSFDDEGNPKLPFDDAPTWSVGKTQEGLDRGAFGVLDETLRCEAIDYAEMRKHTFGSKQLGPAFIGRLMRMAEEADDWECFDARIASIKSDPKRNTARALVDGLERVLGESVSWKQEKDCLVLLLTMGKYYAKQAEKLDGAEFAEEAVR